MGILFHTTKAYVSDCGYIAIYDYKLAAKINKELKAYDTGNYRFKAGDEASFRVRPDQTQWFIERFLSKTRAQTFGGIPKVGWSFILVFTAVLGWL